MDNNLLASSMVAPVIPLYTRLLDMGTGGVLSLLQLFLCINLV